MGEVGDTSSRWMAKLRSSDRLTSIPQAIIDRALLEYPVSFESVLPPAHFANPISLGIHFVHYLLLAPLFAASHDFESVLRKNKEVTRVSSRWNKWEESGQVRGRGLGGGSTVSESIMF